MFEIFLISGCLFVAQTVEYKGEDIRPLLNAIRQVESSNQDNPPDGDNGKSIGPYQIQYNYWKDAVEFDPTIGGKYEDCRKREYAEKIVKAYFLRYGGDTICMERLARIHNGGPRGHLKSSTKKYWDKVRQYLK